MFKDNKEGGTHYQNDGCGEPAHNDFVASATHDELCDGALKHYERLSRMSNEWYSLIPKVIEFYRGHGGKNNDAPKEKDCNECAFEKKGGLGNFDLHTCMKEKDWEKEFYKEFGFLVDDIRTKELENIRSFIQSKISQALEAQKKEIVDEIRKTYLNTTNESLISATEVISLITKNK